MQIDGVQIHGDAGPAVLLLPGGAESCTGFYPGLVEGLVDDPGCRVIVHDRPGTGTSSLDGSLADAVSQLNALIEELGFGPVVVVGQSLGGAVALLLAVEHPEAIAGLVLLDPTPINDPRGCARLERIMGLVGRLTSVPLAGGLMHAQLRSGMRRSMRRSELRPDCKVALENIGNLDLAQLDVAVRGITKLSADFREDRLPQLTAVMVTADRKATSPIARSHERLAAALGAPLVRWPGAAHNLHLDHPEATLATVRDLVARASIAT